MPHQAERLTKGYTIQVAIDAATQNFSSSRRPWCSKIERAWATNLRQPLRLC